MALDFVTVTRVEAAPPQSIAAAELIAGAAETTELELLAVAPELEAPPAAGAAPAVPSAAFVVKLENPLAAMT